MTIDSYGYNIWNGPKCQMSSPSHRSISPKGNTSWLQGKSTRRKMSQANSIWRPQTKPKWRWLSESSQTLMKSSCQGNSRILTSPWTPFWKKLTIPLRSVTLVKCLFSLSLSLSPCLALWVQRLKDTFRAFQWRENKERERENEEVEERHSKLWYSMFKVI